MHENHLVLSCQIKKKGIYLANISRANVTLCQSLRLQSRSLPLGAQGWVRGTDISSSRDMGGVWKPRLGVRLPGRPGYRKGATRRRAQRTEACVLLGGEVVWSPALS